MTQQLEFRTACHNVIDDDAPMRFPGDNRTFTAKDLRALGYAEHELLVLAAPQEDVSAEQRSNWERELGRRVGGTATVISANANLGTGTFETMTNGRTATKPFTFTGAVITTPTFAAPVNAGGPKKGQVSGPTPSPDPYAKELAERRAASVPEPSFEDKWKADRLAELSAQRDRMTTHFEVHPSAPRLTTAEVQSYAPPDPYKADLDKMRRENR